MLPETQPPVAPEEMPPEPSQKQPQDNGGGDDLERSLREAFNRSSNNEKTSNSDKAKSDPIPDDKSGQGDAGASRQPEKKDTARSEPLPEKKEGLVDPSTVADPKNLGKSADGWKTLKSIASKNFEMANQRAQENEQIKKTLAQKDLEYKGQIEKLTKQVEELSGFRAIVDIQADPEFISKYEEPITKLESELKGMLKSMQVSDDVISKIDFQDPQRVSMILDVLDQSSDKITAKRFGRRAEDLIELNDRKNEELQKWKSNHKGLLESKKKEAFERNTQREGVMLKLVDEYASAKDEKTGESKIAFLSKKEPPPNANKEQLKMVEGHNKVVDAMHGRLKEILATDTPEAKVETAIAALASQWLNAQLQDVQRQLEQKTEELKKFTQIDSEGSERTPKAKAAYNPTGADPKTLSIDTAFEHAFPGRR